MSCASEGYERRRRLRGSRNRTVNPLENTARSWYDAGYLNLRRRYARGPNLLANYNFATNLSDAPDFRSPMFESAVPQDNRNLRAEKARPATSTSFRPWAA